MTTYELQIGTHPAKVVPFTFKAPKLPDCNREGKELVKMLGTRQPDRWLIKDTNEETAVGKPYKLIQGRPIPKASKSTRIKEDAIEEVDADEEVLGSESTHLVVSPSLLESLKSSGKAIKFNIILGAGWKVSRALVKPYTFRGKEYLLMKIGRKYLSELDFEAVAEEDEDEMKEEEASEEELNLMATV